MKKMRSESPAIKRREEKKSALPMRRYLSGFETVVLVGNELVVVALVFVASV